MLLLLMMMMMMMMICWQKVQHVKLAREQALSAEESDISDVDDNGCHDNTQVYLMSSLTHLCYIDKPSVRHVSLQH